MTNQRTYIILLFLMLLVISACGRDRNHRVRHLLKSEAEVVQTPIEPVEEEPPVLELRDDVEFDSLTPVMPENFKSQVLERYGYITSYNHETRCPNWVAWRLSADLTDGPYSRKGVPYYDDNGCAIGIPSFTEDVVSGDYFIDMDVPNPRQEHIDWKEHPRGIDHGHMCPAADCCWDKIAMNQSFLLTNMCPQNHDLNGGDWAKLESKCRTWAKHYGQIHIVAGPIFDGNNQQTFGVHKIPIPDAFFKVVLCLQGKPKAIGFFYNNDSSNQPMRNQVRSVDEIESITGFDFFSSLPDELEDAIEALPDFGEWR